MPKYIFRKTEDFDVSIPQSMSHQRCKRGLEEISGREFSSFDQIDNDIVHCNAHIGKKPSELPPNFIIHTLPLTINKLPVYYEHPAGNLLIGYIECKGDGAVVP